MPGGLANSTPGLNFPQIGHLHRLFQSHGPVGRSIERIIQLSHSFNTGHVTINALACDMQMVTSIRARVSASTAV